MAKAAKMGNPPNANVLGRSGLRIDSSEDRRDRDDQLLGVDRLTQVRRESSRHRLLSLARAGICRHGDSGNVAVARTGGQAAKGADERETVLVGHADVADENTERIVGQRV